MPLKNSTMTVAFISDLHLTPENPTSTRLFVEFLTRAAPLLERLYILGDLFDYWVGDDGARPLGHSAIEARLRETVEAGTEVFFMHGNRDFLVGGEFARRSGCRLLPDPVVVRVDGRDFLLSHGDGLCTDDHEHQQSRREMLSVKWKTTFLAQPLEQRMQTAAAIRQRSEVGKRRKSMAAMDVNQGTLEALMGQHGVDTLIHGHTHQPAVHQFELDHKPAWRYVLGDWHAQRSALYYERGKLALKK